MNTAFAANQTQTHFFKSRAYFENFIERLKQKLVFGGFSPVLLNSSHAFSASIVDSLKTDAMKETPVKLTTFFLVDETIDISAGILFEESLDGTISVRLSASGQVRFVDLEAITAASSNRRFQFHLKNAETHRHLNKVCAKMSPSARENQHAFVNFNTSLIKTDPSLTTFFVADCLATLLSQMRASSAKLRLLRSNARLGYPVLPGIEDYYLYVPELLSRNEIRSKDVFSQSYYEEAFGHLAIYSLPFEVEDRRASATMEQAIYNSQVASRINAIKRSKGRTVKLNLDKALEILKKTADGAFINFQLSEEVDKSVFEKDNQTDPDSNEVYTGVPVARMNDQDEVEYLILEI